MPEFSIFNSSESTNSSLAPDNIVRFIQRETLPYLESLVDNAYSLKFGSSEFSSFHQTIRNVQSIFAHSRYLSREELAQIFLTLTPEECSRFRTKISWATTHIEREVTTYFRNHLASLSSAEQESFFDQLARPGTKFEDPYLHFERIPQIQSEMRAAAITDRSRVLIIGSGAVPITAMCLANAGAQVLSIDRDFDAAEAPKHLKTALPSEIASRLEFLHVNGTDFNPRQFAPTHILLTGLTDEKCQILKNLSEIFTSPSDEPTINPSIIVRVPQNNLLKLFYYEACLEHLSEFCVDQIVDIGIEGFNVTYLLSLKNSQTGTLGLS